MTTTLDDDVLDRLIKGQPERADRFISALAFRLEGYAKDFAPVMYGALKNSIFTRTSKTDGLSAAIAAALAKNPAVTCGDPTPGTPPLGTAYVAPSVDYALWQEIGTSRMAAQPYMTPAVERTNGDIPELAKGFFDDVG
jgi:hypothetical protein